MDTPELQALFDQHSLINFPTQEPPQPASSSDDETLVITESASPDWQRACQETDSDEMFYHIASLVRKLHDALREIGQDSALFHAQDTIPESRERLSYIGDIMEKSAHKTLTLAEREMPLLDDQIQSLSSLKEQWQKVLNGSLSLEDFKKMAQSMPNFIDAAIQTQSQSKQAFLDILMAQDFQDLAGQTLSKIIQQMTTLERDLLQLLSIASPESTKRDRINEFLEGPQFKTNVDNTSVVTNQSDVDDLLKELGF